MDFGRIETQEHALYALTTSTPVIPRLLFVDAPGSSPRSFIVVPDASLSATFKTLGKLPRSTALGAHFQYLGGEPLELQIQDTLATETTMSMTFAIARWGRQSTAPFPRAIYVLAEEASVGHAEQEMIEVLRAVCGPITEEEQTS